MAGMRTQCYMPAWHDWHFVLDEVLIYYLMKKDQIGTFLCSDQGPGGSGSQFGSEIG